MFFYCLFFSFLSFEFCFLFFFPFTSKTYELVRFEPMSRLTKFFLAVLLFILHLQKHRLNIKVVNFILYRLVCTGFACKWYHQPIISSRPQYRSLLVGNGKSGQYLPRYTYRKFRLENCRVVDLNVQSNVLEPKPDRPVEPVEPGTGLRNGLVDPPKPFLVQNRSKIGKPE